MNAWLGQACPWAHKSHLTTCILMVVALIHSGEVNLTRWLPYLPSRGRYAQSKQRRVRRWLGNSRINIHKLYKSLIRAALADWQDESLYLSLDTSLFWDQYCLIRIALVHRGRALPVAWRVLHHRSATVAFNDYKAVVNQAAQCVPTGIKVILLADRGFAHPELMQALTQQWHWSYRIRLKKDTWVWRTGKGWAQLQDFHFNRGEALCFHAVRIHKDAWYGPVHLAVGRNNVNGEFWAIVSDELTTLQTFCEYGLRFDIEESFLDDQSNGWNVQKSQIRSVCDLSRLWFILAIATLFVTAQGGQVVANKQRRWVDPHWFRGNSYFRIGWDWLKASALNGWHIIQNVTFFSHRDPEPAIVSRKHHEKHAYRLEFKVFTYDYAAD
ncbi:MAG: transposase [Cyanobacteria bacterium P01_F01_bin.53]